MSMSDFKLCRCSSTHIIVVCFGNKSSCMAKNKTCYSVYMCSPYPGSNSAWSPAPPRCLRSALCTQCRWTRGWHARRAPAAAPAAVCCPMQTPHRRTPRPAWTATGLPPEINAELWCASAGSDWRKSHRFAPRRIGKNSWKPGGGEGPQMTPGFHKGLHGNCYVWTQVKTF